MKFIVNCSDFNDALSTVTRALSARPAKQVLEGVLIDADDNGLVLTCTDGNLSIRSNISAMVEEVGRAVLPGRLLGDLVRKLPEGDVSVEVRDNRAATIRCMTSRFTLMGMNAAEYPEIAPMDSDALTVGIPQNRLRDMISHVVFSIAVDETRQILTGCLLEMTCDQANMVALDGYRLAMQTLNQPTNLPADMPVLKAVIPGRVLNEMARILPDDETRCTMSFSNGRMQAVFGNTVLATVLLAGEYIDYRRILPPSFKTEAIVKKSELASAIDFASLMAREGKNNLIRLNFAEGSVTISSNAETGDANQRIDAELNGDPIEIAFNAKYLADVIRNISEEKLCMKFNSNVSPCVFTPTEKEESFLYLILPVRIFQ